MKVYCTVKKVVLYILCLFAIICSINIGRFLERSAAQKQQQFSRTNSIYLYDSQKKIEQWLQDVENAYTDWNIDWDKEERENLLAKIKECPPLAVVGPFGIFHDSSRNTYLVGKPNTDNPIAEICVDNDGQETRILDSKVLKGWIVPHASCIFKYDENGAFVQGMYSTSFQDNKINRIYVDSNGTGQFDKMIISEDGVRTVYKMIGKTWTKEESH